uniref:Uncharacterized protein n=1 Tax=Noctiluca scintillans TaxID=2966 RepID=A0A7S1AGS2_NOCSC
MLTKVCAKLEKCLGEKEAPIPIDSLTEIPADLFRALVKAGAEANARGQHQMRCEKEVKICSSGAEKVRRLHLVRNDTEELAVKAHVKTSKVRSKLALFLRKERHADTTCQ